MRIQRLIGRILSPLALVIAVGVGCSSTNRSEKPAVVETTPMANEPAPQEIAPTAGRLEGNSTSDVDLTAQIRRSIMEEPNLSVTAQNVRIAVVDGVVTLTGSVLNTAEKSRIEQLAAGTVGVDRVKSELTISE